MAFNPFRKQPHENLTEDDLAGLIRDEVAEGSPLFDLDQWADHIHRYGVPICERSDFMIPEDLTRAPRIKNVPNMWFLVGSVLAEALGVPRPMFTPLIVHAMSRAQERTRNGA